MYVAAITQALLGCSSPAPITDDADVIRDLEQGRLRALVGADLEVMEELHADEFELINPDGEKYSRGQYLGEIRSGVLDYAAWEAGEMAVRMYPGVAVVRYQDLQFEVRYEGNIVGNGRFRHTNVYEKHNGRWQIVWSHASGGS